jgi:hypothetical protein
MAFCTSCGSSMDPNALVCANCGKSISPASTSATAAAAAPAQAQAAVAPPASSSGAGTLLKILGVLVVVVVLFGMIGIGSIVYFAHRMKHRVHVAQNGSSNSVDFGPFKASTNSMSASELASKIGVDLYPGATQQGETAEAEIGKMTTASMKLTTTDSLEKVASFYRQRYPHATAVKENTDRFTLATADSNGTLTIKAESMGSETLIEIAKVGGIKIDIETH